MVADRDNLEEAVPDIHRRPIREVEEPETLLAAFPLLVLSIHRFPQALLLQIVVDLEEELAMVHTGTITVMHPHQTAPSMFKASNLVF